MTPKRIQRKRTKGWRMPENAVYVGRPTKWGNPFNVGQMAQPIPRLNEIDRVPNNMGGYTFYYNGSEGIPMVTFDDGPLTIESVLRKYKTHILERVPAAPWALREYAHHKQEDRKGEKQ